MASAVPREPARFFASTSVPETRSARSSAVVTDAPSTVFSMGAATAPTSSELFGPHVHRVDATVAVGERLELRELDVDVRRLAAERRLGEADDRERLPAELDVSPIPRFSRLA